MENKKYKTLEDIYIDNRRLVFSYITDYSTDKDFVEELASIIWLKVWEHAEVFLNMDKKGVKYYLRAMTKNSVSDYFRGIEKEKELVKNIGESMQVAEHWDDGIRILFTEDMDYYLREAIKVLTEEERFLIILRFKQERSVREVGAILEITESNVRVRQMRILSKMKKHIKKLMDEGRNSDEFKGK